MVIVNIKRWKRENNFVQIVKICKKIEKGTKGTVVNLSFLTQREIISLLLCYITYIWWWFVILIFCHLFSLPFLINICYYYYVIFFLLFELLVQEVSNISSSPCVSSAAIGFDLMTFFTLLPVRVNVKQKKI